MNIKPVAVNKLTYLKPFLCQKNVISFGTKDTFEKMRSTSKQCQHKYDDMF